MERTRTGRWAWILAAAPAALYATTPLSDRDWPWHLADFARMTHERLAPWDRALWQDRYSYASEGDFLPVHWIFEVLTGAAHRALGLAGIEAVRLLFVVAIFALLQRLLARRGLGPLASSALALIVAAITKNRLIERPHLVTLLGFVILWDQLLAFRAGKKKTLWALVPLYALWANMHPGVVYAVIFGLGFAVAEAFRLPRERARSLALWVMAAILATLITPYGGRLYPYLLEHIAMQKKMHIAELRPLGVHHLPDVLFLAALAPAAFIVVRAWRSGAKTDVVDLLATAGFIALAALAAREANLALIALSVAIAPALADTIEEAKLELAEKPAERGLHVFAWSFALVCGFGLPVAALGQELLCDELGTGLGPGQYPVREADWIIANRPRGKLWNTNASGGYLIWRLDPIANPDWQVFTDGRQPLFTRAVNMPFAEIERLFAPNLLVLDPLSPPWEGAPGENAHAWLEKFQLVHFSDGGRTYLRRGGADAALLERFAYRHVRFDGVPDPASPYGHRLRILIDDEHPREAKEELLRGALREEPGGHWANVALAEILFREGDQAGAVQAARRALDVRKNVEALEILRRFEAPR